MKLLRLSATQFDQVAASTRLKPATREMARQVLVEGKAAAAVAADVGMTRQRVSLAVAAIERAYKTSFPSNVQGKGVVRVEIEIPERLARALWELGEALDRPGNALSDRHVEAIQDAVGKATAALK